MGWLRGLSFLLAGMALGCGGSATAVRRPVAAAVDDGAGDVVEQPAPPLDVALPADAAIVGAFDGAALLRHPLVAGIAHAALARIDLVDVLGLDASRPITFAVSSLDPESRRAVARLAALAPPVSASAASTVQAPTLDPAIVRRVTAAWRGLRTPWLHARIVVPVTTPDTCYAGVRPLVEELGLRKRRRAPSGMDGVACEESGGACVGFSHDRSSVVIDALVPAYYAFPTGEGRQGAGELARNALVELARIRNTSRGDVATSAPALAGALARASWVPERVAEMTFAYGVARALDVIGFGGVDPSQQSLLMTQGLYDASRAFELAGGAHGTYFDHVDVAAEGAIAAPTFRVHAVAGPGAPAAPVAAPAPSTSIAVDTSFAAVDVSHAWLASLTLPGARPSSGAGYDRALEEAGAASLLIALPQWLAFMARFATEGEPGDFAFSPAVSARLDRTVSVFDDLDSDDPTLRIGVLPAGTTEASASCVLVEEPTPCTRRNRLRAGVPAPVEHGFVRLEHVGDRFALVGGRDRGLVAVRSLRAAPGHAGPASARIVVPPQISRLVTDLVDVPGPFTWLPHGYDLSLDIDGTGWTVGAVPTSAAVSSVAP